MNGSDDELDSNAPISDAEGASASDADDDYADVQSSWTRKLFNKSEASSADPLTSIFDLYFTQATSSSRTSSNLYSHLVPSLSPDDFQTRLRDVRKNSRESKRLDEKVAGLERSHRQYFQVFLDELTSGFNILFYGYGSKRVILNKLARLCAKKGHVVVGNGFFLNFAMKDLLSAAIELVDAPDIADAAGTGSGIEGQCRRVLAKYTLKPNARHLFFVIHNIDGPALRSERARNCLRSLASHPSIHLLASVDHIMASSLFSTTETFSQDGGFRWLWHDLSTFRPYDFETAFVDRTSYAGASIAHQQRNKGSAGAMGGIAGSGGVITENAAKHVLASVTAKAKRLFALLCARQLSAMKAAQAEGTSVCVVQSSEEHATPYELLFQAARDEFIATNEVALRALLGEFRDHNLVLSTTAPEGGEALWIPLSKEGLERLAGGIE